MSRSGKIPPERSHSGENTERIATLEDESVEIRITVDRDEATRKRFGVQLFADDDHEGLEVLLKPETGTLRVGVAEAPFAVAGCSPCRCGSFSTGEVASSMHTGVEVASSMHTGVPGRCVGQ